MDRGRKAASALDESARARVKSSEQKKKRAIWSRAIKEMMIFKTILIFCVRIHCVIRFVLLIYYSIINNEYMIIMRRYLGFNKYSFFIILLRV